MQYLVKTLMKNTTYGINRKINVALWDFKVREKRQKIKKLMQKKIHFQWLNRDYKIFLGSCVFSWLSLTEILDYSTACSTAISSVERSNFCLHWNQ